MTLLVISVDAFPTMGGISVMGHHLCNAFERLGTRAVFLGPAGTFVPREYVRDYRLVEDHESQVRVRSGNRAPAQDRRITRLVDAIITRYDVRRILLLHPFYYALGALAAAQRHGIPVSTYFHGFELRSQFSDGYAQAYHDTVRHQRTRTLAERVFLAAGQADEVLTNSRYTASLFDALSPKPTVRFTGCGITEEVLERELHLSPAYNPVERDARKAELGLRPGPMAAYVGRLVATKRVDRLIHACAIAPELSAVVVGEGPEKENLVSLAADLGVTERVRFLGRTAESVKWRILRAADFLCLLSEPKDDTGQVEGFGIALLEGAAAGAVPVSSGSGGMIDVVQHELNGLITRASDDSLAEQLMILSGTPVRMGSLVAAAREQLSNRYTWTRVASRILANW